MMISIQEKIEVEKRFLKKYPNDILSSWDASHYDIPRIISEKNYKIGVEVGVAYGGHSESILSNTQVNKLFGIDPYEFYKDYEGDNQNFEQQKQDDIYHMVKAKLLYYDDRFELIRDFSKNAVDMFEDYSLDFVYIDGNHFDEYVREDISNWWIKVRQGGMVSGHDYNHPAFPNLTKIVNYFFEKIEHKVEYLGNHNWCVYKS